MKSVEHVRRDHNLMIPDLSSDFTLFDFTYDLPLSTYLGQYEQTATRKYRENHFNFNRLVIDHDADVISCFMKKMPTIM